MNACGENYQPPQFEVNHSNNGDNGKDGVSFTFLHNCALRVTNAQLLHAPKLPRLTKFPEPHYLLYLFFHVQFYYRQNECMTVVLIIGKEIIERTAFLPKRVPFSISKERGHHGASICMLAQPIRKTSDSWAEFTVCTTS